MREAAATAAVAVAVPGGGRGPGSWLGWGLGSWFGLVAAAVPRVALASAARPHVAAVRCVALPPLLCLARRAAPPAAALARAQRVVARAPAAAARGAAAEPRSCRRLGHWTRHMRGQPRTYGWAPQPPHLVCRKGPGVQRQRAHRLDRASGAGHRDWRGRCRPAGKHRRGGRLQGGPVLRELDSALSQA